MNINEFIVLAAAGALQLITISLWLYAREESQVYRALYDSLRRHSIRRDPRTGRYLKQGA